LKRSHVRHYRYSIIVTARRAALATMTMATPEVMRFTPTTAQVAEPGQPAMISGTPAAQLHGR
jgi:hypothetical protein